MAIIGDRIDNIEATVSKREPTSFESVNIAIDDIKEREDGLLEIKYTYNIKYRNNSANMKLSGIIVAKEEEELKKKILEEWEKGKKEGKTLLPKDYLEMLLNSINFIATAHATVVARVLNFPPPISPPIIRVKDKG